MRRLTSMMGFLLAALLLLGRVQAQQESPPLVLFVQQRTLDTAEMDSFTPDSLIRLTLMFRELGATTRITTLDEPLDDADILVLVRPRNPLNSIQTTRVWDFLKRGGHLLLAIDPSGFDNMYTEDARGGLMTLLGNDYGVSLLNGMILEPEFTGESLTDVDRSFSFVYADSTFANPITAPLLRYQIPVAVWGARPTESDVLAIYGSGRPLLSVDEPAFAEADPAAFRTNTIQLNIGQDPQGLLNVGAIGINHQTGSRVALLSDAEMLMNGFGMTIQADGSQTPLFPGNYILAQRLTAWLMEVPEEEWPTLPDNFTYVSIDGADDEWSEGINSLEDPNDNSILPLDIRQVRGFSNRTYAYFYLETQSAPSADAQVEFVFDSDDDGNPDRSAIIDATNSILRTGTGETAVDTVLPFSAIAIGSGIEVRVPLRAFGPNGVGRISTICINSARELAFPPPPDCLATGFEPSVQRSYDLVMFGADSRFPALVRTNQTANVRQVPAENAPVLGTVTGNESVNITARNEQGNWFYVESPRVSGWMAGFLLQISGDINLLPRLDAQGNVIPEATPEPTEEATPEATEAATAEATPEVTATPAP